MSKKLDAIQQAFLEPLDASDKAWGAMNDFFNDVLTYMEAHNITYDDIARKLGVSRAYVTRAFRHYKPNTNILRFAEIAHALGLNLKLTITGE
jgi:cyanate lyase